MFDEILVYCCYSYVYNLDLCTHTPEGKPKNKNCFKCTMKHTAAAAYFMIFFMKFLWCLNDNEFLR